MTTFTITNETQEEHLIYFNALSIYSTLDEIRKLLRNHNKHGADTKDNLKKLINSIQNEMHDFKLE